MCRASGDTVSVCRPGVGHTVSLLAQEIHWCVGLSETKPNHTLFFDTVTLDPAWHGLDWIFLDTCVFKEGAFCLGYNPELDFLICKLGSKIPSDQTMFLVTGSTN